MGEEDDYETAVEELVNDYMNRAIDAVLGNQYHIVSYESDFQLCDVDDPDNVLIEGDKEYLENLEDMR